MGYSISVAAKDAALQERMYAFLGKHYRYLCDLPDSEHKSSALRLAIGGHENEDGLSYPPNTVGDEWDWDKDGIPPSVPHLVGFDYGPITGEERHYAVDVMAWVSRKISATPNTFYYHDDEEYTWRERTPKERIKLLVMECLGLISASKSETFLKFIDKELQRLDALWEKQ
jgi:hypothetical protein